jgi:hypothetical protein
MSSFPIIYPEERGEGRCTKLIWLRQDEASAVDQQALDNAFPSALQILRGKDYSNENRAVIVVDSPLTINETEVPTPHFERNKLPDCIN